MNPQEESLPMKIYIVTAGEYSDYHIVAAFTDETKADAHAYPFRDYRVEEYNLNPDLPSYLKPGYKIYNVSMFSDGELAGGPYGLYQAHYETNPSAIGHLQFRDFAYPGNGDRDGNNPRTGEWYIHGTVQARDEQHAVKIMNEKRVQLIAGNRWPDRVTNWCRESGDYTSKVRHPDYKHHHVEAPKI